MFCCGFSVFRQRAIEFWDEEAIAFTDLNELATCWVMWNVRTGKEIFTLQGHSSWVNSIAFSPDGQTLASGSRDKTIKLWDVGTKREKQVLKGHVDWVNSVAFSPNGRILASGSYDATIKLRHVRTGREICILKGYSLPCDRV